MNAILPAYRPPEQAGCQSPTREFSVFGVTGSATVVGIQRVKVPAGTFTALVLCSTLN